MKPNYSNLESIKTVYIIGEPKFNVKIGENVQMHKTMLKVATPAEREHVLKFESEANKSTIIRRGVRWDLIFGFSYSL